MDGFSRREILTAVMGSAPAQALKRRMEEASLGFEPQLTHVTIAIPGLDRRLDGMRIGQVSDVHIGQGFRPEYLKRALDVFGRRPPDMLVCTGDLIDEPAWSRACFDLLADRKAPYGTFYSLGNHENFRDREHIVDEAMKHDRLQLLVNRGVIAQVQGARVFVSGVDFPVEQSATAQRAPINAQFVAAANARAGDGDVRICLAHHPDDFDEIRSHGVELTLSGHTHGGQNSLLDPLITRYYRYFKGHYRVDGKHLYVNAATAGSHFFRVGAPPEVTELTLRRV